MICMRIHKGSVKLEFMTAGFSQVYATEQIAYINKGNVFFFNFPFLGWSIIVCAGLFVSGLGLCEISVKSWRKTDI